MILNGTKINLDRLPKIDRYREVPEPGTIVYTEPTLDFSDDWHVGKESPRAMWSWIDTRAVILANDDGTRFLCDLNIDPYESNETCLVKQITNDDAAHLFKTQRDAVYAVVEYVLDNASIEITNALYLLRTYPC